MKCKKAQLSLTITCLFALIASACSPVSYFSKDLPINKTIDRVQNFPDIPSSYRYFDYQEKAQKLDELLFSFAESDNVVFPTYISDDMSTWSPLGFWVDQAREPTTYNPLETGYLRRTFGFPTYVADNRVASSGSEAMTTISSILGSSYAGIDKQNQVIGTKEHDFVEMTLASYDTGSQLVHNVGLQGQSFWYDIFPQIMFARLYDLYPNTPFMREMVLNGADQWLESLPYFKIGDYISYEFVGFNVVLKSPTLIGNHIEPPNGGLAFLFYAAYQMTGDEKYLDGAKEVLDYLQTYQKNPNYEALTDYAPLVAAVLNRDHGTNYDIGKFLDYIFDGDSSFRPGWSVLSGNFGSYPVDGLVGQAGDYAFLMNSLHLATVLAPMIKYDVRYATEIGKYLLNLTNNARYFFPQSLSLSHQSMTGYLPFDNTGAIAYEGFRNMRGAVNGYAMGDVTKKFAPNAIELTADASFMGGNVAMIFGGHMGDWYSYDALGLDWDIQVLPTPNGLPEARGGEISADAFGISARSDNVPGSFAFLELWTGEEGALQMYKYGKVSALKNMESLINELPESDQKDIAIDVVFDAMEKAVTLPNERDFSKVMREMVMSEIYLLMFNGRGSKSDVTEVLTTIKTNVDNYYRGLYGA